MQYKVIPGPTMTVGGMLSGPVLGRAAEPIERIIQQAAQAGWKLHSIDSTVARGKLCCIFPQNVEVKLIIVYRDD
jgi:hypothetical protein